MFDHDTLISKMRKFIPEDYMNYTIIVNNELVYKDYFEKNEIWRPFIFEGKITDYDVSSKGRVRKGEEIIPPNTLGHKYLSCTLIIGKKRKLVGVHRMVAMTFVQIPKRHRENRLGFNDLLVNHIDGQKWHNTPTNLEWVTGRENMYHARESGLNRGILGENSHLATITNKTARECCEMLAAGENPRYIAEELGMTIKQVRHIKYRECWREISKNYTFPNDKNRPKSLAHRDKSVPGYVVKKSGWDWNKET